MSYTLVTVGGTGRDFAKLLGWMNQLGFVEPPSRVIFVDGDPAGSTQVPEFLGFANDNINYSTGSRVVKPYQANTNSNAKVNLLHQFDLADHAGNDAKRSPLLNLSFTIEEQNKELSHGFYSNPKLASTVFLQKESSAPEVIKAILGSGAERLTESVVIVGSISGGTGAGLIYSLARLCKEKQIIDLEAERPSFIIGLIYSKYLNIGDATKPNNSDLVYNSVHGSDFLWKNWYNAFDRVYLMGAEDRLSVRNRTNNNQEMVAPYPGFLLGINLICDGLKVVVSEHRQYLTEIDPQTPPEGFYLYSANKDTNSNIYLKGQDINFIIPDPKNTTSIATKVSMNEMKVYLKKTNNILDEILSFPMDDALSPLSMFPLRKLPPKLVEAFKNANKERMISISNVKSFYSRLKTICNQLKKTIEEFNNWIEYTKQYGLQIDNLDECGHIKDDYWLDNLGEFQIVDNIEKSAQKALKSTYSKIVKPSSILQGAGQINFWIYPYASFDPMGQGWTLIPTRMNPNGINTKIDITEEAIGGSCYPTPLGRMEYFKHSLAALSTTANKGHAVYRDSERIWYGLALGELYIETINLDDYSKLEKTIKNATNQESIGLVKNKKGEVIAASNPICGFWSGLNGFSNAMLDNLLANKDNLDKARSVLRYWFSSLENLDGYQEIQTQTWYKFLASLGLNTAPDLTPEDKECALGTHSPIALKIGLDQITGKEKTLFFYPIFYQPFRKQLRNHLVASVIASTPNPNPNQKSFKLHKSNQGYVELHYQNRKVASIKVPKIAVDANEAEILKNIRNGVFHLTIEPNYPVWSLDPIFFRRGDQNINLFIGKLQECLQYNISNIQHHFAAQNTHLNSTIPELFWHLN